MATSGSANFSTTRDEIIKHALLNVNEIGIGETPSADQTSNAAFLLNLIVKAWQADGMPLWANKLFSFSLTATNSYTIGVSATVNTPRPLKIVSAFMRENTDFIDTPMDVITQDEYDSLSSKTSTGRPLQLFYDARGGSTSTGIIYLWPTPDTETIADYSCYIRYQRPFEDFDASTDEPDFPQEWFMALVWQLSWALCPRNGIPLDERKLMKMEADLLHNQALLFNVEEGSMYIEPQQG